MFKAVKYVFNEHINNIYMIIRLAKYDVVLNHRDAYLGFLWFVIGPLLQIGTYWFAFGLGIRNGKAVNGVPYFQWMLPGIISWFFISSCILKGSKSIYSKASIIKKIKFPTSIIPTTEVVGQLFDHICMVIIMLLILFTQGYNFKLYNLQLVYYIFCALVFGIAISMVNSVLTMVAIDLQKMVQSVVKMLFFATPILWTMDKMPKQVQFIMKLNPIYYITNGYRTSFFHSTKYTNNIEFTCFFWVLTIALLVIGSQLLYKLRHKFIDLI
jgi:teichoic acid transport system permease protein